MPDASNEKPSANMIALVLALVGVLAFFSIYAAYPHIFPSIESLPPPP
jgi:hypothetical protein